MEISIEEQKANLDRISLSKVKSDVGSLSEPINKKPKLTEKDEPMQSESEIKTEAFNIEDSNPGTSKNCDSDGEDDVNLDPIPPTPGFTYPLEQDASDMLEELQFNDGFPSVTDRYFTPYYELDVLKPGDDICLRIHSNRICMISLAPSHVIFQKNKTIQSCNYKVSEKLDRTANKVSGKAKHGAQPLQSNSNLCCLTCTDGSSYMIKCCMIGKLIEVNTRLIEDPELLKQEPHFGGYIAIVLPNLKHLDKLKEKLLDQVSYEQAIRKRKEEKENQVLEIENDKRANENSDVETTKVNCQ